MANAGPSTARTIQVSDTLPTGMRFISSPDGCTAAGQLVTCPAVASMLPGARTQVVIRVEIDPAYTGDGSDLRNTATVTAATGDPVVANNSSSFPGPPGGMTEPQADVAIAKTVSPDAVVPGGTFAYTLTATSNGPSVATNVVVNDPLPPCCPSSAPRTAARPPSSASPARRCRRWRWAASAAVHDLRTAGPGLRR